MTPFIKFLPGDLISFTSEHLCSRLLIISVDLDDVDECIYYEAIGSINKKGTNESIKHYTISDPLVGSFTDFEIQRMFQPDTNYLCYEDNCAINKICGGCFSDCPYKYEYHDPGDRIYYPDDIVFSPGDRHLLKITQVFAEFIATDRNYTFRELRTTYGITEFLKNFNFTNFPETSIAKSLFDSYKKSGLISLRYCYNDLTLGINSPKSLGLSGNDIRLRKRGKYYALRSDIIGICEMCIYKDTENCNTCKTNKLICQIPEKNLQMSTEK